MMRTQKKSAASIKQAAQPCVKRFASFSPLKINIFYV